MPLSASRALVKLLQSGLVFGRAEPMGAAARFFFYQLLGTGMRTSMWTAIG